MNAPAPPMPAAAQPLTDQQRAALEAHGRSVSLAAGAGCGKTFVLTERFLAELDPAGAVALHGEGAELDQVIAITFTDAAAREMRDRIRRRCYQRLQSAGSDAEAAAWQWLLRSMDAARISTIHAFCTALLRTHAVQAGLDPQFEVLDAPAAELLRLETIDDRLRLLLVERNDDVLDYAAQRGLDRLRDELASFAGPLHAPAIARWREALPEQLVAVWAEHLVREAPRLAARELLGSAEIREMRRACDPARTNRPAVQAHVARLAQELREQRILEQPIDAVLRTLDDLARVRGVCQECDWDDPSDYSRFGKAATNLRRRLKKLGERKQMVDEEAQVAARLGLALVRLAADVSERLEASKTRRNQLEFDDLLARADRLLNDPASDAIRRQIARRTRLVMVDEFQDTNPLQVRIIKALCGDDWSRRGLFAVGDFKQSIYRFNGAQPSVSTELRAELPPAGRLSLTTNFRSQPAVLDLVNALFVDALPDYEPLVPARGQSTPTPAVEFLWAPGPGAQADGCDESAAPGAGRRRKGATRDARAEEARWIARRIVQLLESGDPIVADPGDRSAPPRPLQPGDVVILLRALGDAQVYEEALREAGLSYYLAGGHAFYAQQEIFDILNLLRAVASDVDEIALAGALRSPLFALADETLFWLVETNGSLNAGLCPEPNSRLPQGLDPAEAAKARHAAAVLHKLRLQKDRLLVAELLGLALELTGYDATILAEFLGPRKGANIQKLLEQARALDASSPGDLPAFITQLTEFVTHAPKEALAATQAQGAGVIRIMTIHYAKGLEFPLVVIPDLARPRHAGNAEPVLDPELGPLVPLSEAAGSVGFDLYRWLDAVEDLEERKRLLYVALTRAADYLILSSSIDDLDCPSGDWLSLIDARICLADGSLRGELPPGYGTPQVRVIRERPTLASEPEGASHGVDLHRLVTKTRSLASGAVDPIPRDALPIPPDLGARRRFSFSTLTGLIAPADWLETDAEGLPAQVSDRGQPGDEDSADPEAAGWGAAGWEGPAGGPAEAEALRGRPAGDVVPGETAGGREFGKLVHAILEQVDLRTPGDIGALAGWLAPRFALPEPDHAIAEAVAVVERFLQTPVGVQLASAKIVRREVEFLLPWPPGETPQRRGGRYLQGYLDCLAHGADGRWRLFDYKTNRATPRQVPAVVAHYELQMLAYRLACEAALGEPLAECTLVLLHTGGTHSYAWDEAAERRGVARITAAMDQMSAPAGTV